MAAVPFFCNGLIFDAKSSSIKFFYWGQPSFGLTNFLMVHSHCVTSSYFLFITDNEYQYDTSREEEEKGN